MTEKTFVSPDRLVRDAFLLARHIYESGIGRGIATQDTRPGRHPGGRVAWYVGCCAIDGRRLYAHACVKAEG